jgi:hypothetical protein
MNEFAAPSPPPHPRRGLSPPPFCTFCADVSAAASTRSNPHYPQQLVSRYLTAPHVATLYDHLNHAVSSFGPRPCLGTREWRGPPHAPGPYRWMTFEQMGIARTEVASGLLAYGVGYVHLHPHRTRLHLPLPLRHVRASDACTRFLVGASSAGAFVGLYSSNCAEWLLCEHAAFSQSMVRVLTRSCWAVHAIAPNTGGQRAACCSVTNGPTR